MIPKETVLSGANHPGTQVEIMRAPGGAYYLGFRDLDGVPYSRETEYMDRITAELILSNLRK